MDLYLKVRHAHFQDGLSGRQIARDFGISRDSVAKMLAYSEPPGYRRTAPIRRPKLDAFTSQMDQWLAEDRSRPRKQRHNTANIRIMAVLQLDKDHITKRRLPDLFLSFHREAVIASNSYPYGRIFDRFLDSSGSGAILTLQLHPLQYRY